MSGAETAPDLVPRHGRTGEESVMYELDRDRVREAITAAAGAPSPAALRDAVEVRPTLAPITRFADTIGATPHSAQGLTREQAISHQGRFSESGYA